VHQRRRRHSPGDHANGGVIAVVIRSAHGRGPVGAPPEEHNALDGWGIDQSILFPQWGLEFETMFFDDDLC